jgi:hypothetical protein
MKNDATDAQILVQEQQAIELLARETHTAIPIVQDLFLVEYTRLRAGARIQSFIPVLTSSCVRGLLGARNSALESP